MNRRFAVWLFNINLLFTSGFLHAEIREVTSMREVIPLIDEDSLVVVDIDNTTLRPTQTLGSDQFFQYVRAAAEDRGLKGDAAIESAVNEVTPIQPVSPVRPVEAITPGLIRAMQKRGVRLFALTARPSRWSEGTLRQLRSLGVDFGVTAPGIPTGVWHQTPGRGKGEDLAAIVSALNPKPSKVVFIDDKLNHVKSVERAMNKTSIPHFSLRYSAADAWVRTFDSQVAELEWQTFRETGRFMSDEEARELLRPPLDLPVVIGKAF